MCSASWVWIPRDIGASKYPNESEAPALKLQCVGMYGLKRKAINQSVLCIPKSYAPFQPKTLSSCNKNFKEHYMLCPGLRRTSNFSQVWLGSIES